MVLKFEAWLNNQQAREDEIGALARMPGMQGLGAATSRRAFDEHRSWVDLVVRITDTRYVPVFNDAWQEFLVAKKEAAHDSPD